MPLAITSFLILSILSTTAHTQAPAPSIDHELLNLTPAELDQVYQYSRASKDSLLGQGEDSPLLPNDKTAFQGLHYFPINHTLRLVGELHIYGHQRQIQIPTTANTVLPMERFGRIHFRLDGKPFWLEVYRSHEDHQKLVFFKDATNGQQTYGGGRYMPITPLSDGYYLVDFNSAYNPYCAYNPEYICPLPPPNNILDIAIRAGETNYGKDLAQ